MMRMEERYKAALEQLRGGLISTDLVAVKRYVEVIDEALAQDAPVGKWPTEVVDAMEGRESKPEEQTDPWQDPWTRYNSHNHSISVQHADGVTEEFSLKGGSALYECRP